MKTLEHDPIDASVRCGRRIRENVASRRNREESEEGLNDQSSLLHREMEDWYRGEENRSMAGAA